MILAVTLALMTGFLVHYNRKTAKVTVERHDDSDEAIQAFNRGERALGPDEEVVLLFADSEATIRKTHPRFFMSTREYLQQAVREVVDERRSA